MLKDGINAHIRKDSYVVPEIFKLLQKNGNIEEKIMYNTYNMGIGMLLALKAEDADAAVKTLEAAGEKAYIVGELKKGEKGITLL